MTGGRLFLFDASWFNDHTTMTPPTISRLQLSSDVAAARFLKTAWNIIQLVEGMIFISHKMLVHHLWQQQIVGASALLLTRSIDKIRQWYNIYLTVMTIYSNYNVGFILFGDGAIFANINSFSILPTTSNPLLSLFLSLFQQTSISFLHFNKTNNNFP